MAQNDCPDFGDLKAENGFFDGIKMGTRSSRLYASYGWLGVENVQLQLAMS
jgi:hypothetical protein